MNHAVPSSIGHAPIAAFVASGFEHSVANMTIFSVALLGNHPPEVSLTGMLHNLAWVTLGNAIAGALFVAGAYGWVNEPIRVWSKKEAVAHAPAE